MECLNQLLRQRQAQRRRGQQQTGEQSQEQDPGFMLFAVLFMFIGAQFVGMGLLGEYIGRIYNDVRARPRYFIQRVVRQPETASKEEDRS